MVDALTDAEDEPVGNRSIRRHDLLYERRDTDRMPRYRFRELSDLTGGPE